jgi:3-deoxy-D-manno-octulosonate 8-phosphate phosphatase (KDO 8-P phosphatase)
MTPVHADVSLISLRAAARRLKLMAFDVDGVLTDGRLYYGADGEELKVFHTLDGHGLKMLAAAGVTLALITGRRSAMVLKRASELGIGHVFQGREDKAEALAALAAELGLDASACGYAGDDLPDVGALEWAALAFSVPNAHDSARDAADLITRRGGGEGAVREICDFILAARGVTGA